MVVGFNHNIMYRGEVFHVQTEDSGVNNPHIITLLYRGGTIITSKKTSYADILRIENLEQVVEELMKEQHKDILRRLKSGEFDARAFPVSVPAASAPQAKEPVPPTAPEPVAASAPSVAAAPQPVAGVPPAAAAPEPVAAAAEPVAAAPPVAGAPPPVAAAAPPVPPPVSTPSSAEAKPAKSLDEIILNYLVAGDD